MFKLAAVHLSFSLALAPVYLAFPILPFTILPLFPPFIIPAGVVCIPREALAWSILDDLWMQTCVGGESIGVGFHSSLCA